MAKVKSEYVCTDCGTVHGRWSGQCPDCGSWNTFEERQAAPTGGEGKGAGRSIAKTGRAAGVAAPVRKLGDSSAADYPRYSTGMHELDRVLGGGVVPGSAVVLGGAPGGGKSTMCSSLADNLAGQGKRVAYVAGEESPQQIRLRTQRMGLTHIDEIDMITETEVSAICARLASGYDFAIIDSIQMLWDAELAGAPGSVTIVKEVGQALVRTAKEHGVAVMIIGHYTKDGNLAGPRHFEHMVDTVLTLEGEATTNYRILRAVKNRFGATHELGVFEMTSQGMQGVSDPSSLFLRTSTDLIPGVVCCPVIEGSRPILVEVQALAPPVHGANTPARRPRGIDRNRLDMLAAVLSQRSGQKLSLGSRDLYVNISGGLRVEDPAIDLAVCIAIASAATNRPVKAGFAAFGELALTGELRPVNQHERRTEEARRLGWPTVLGAPGQGTHSGKYLSAILRQALGERLDDEGAGRADENVITENVLPSPTPDAPAATDQGEEMSADELRALSAALEN